jgi:hypothetical protein
MIRVHSLHAFREFLRFHIAAWREKNGLDTGR